MSAELQTRRWKPSASGSAPTQVEAFRELDADLFLAHQLFRAGRSATVIQGVTTATERKERIRREIIEAKFERRYLLDARGKPTEETFGRAFERLYRERITPQGQPPVMNPSMELSSSAPHKREPAPASGVPAPGVGRR